MRDGGSRRTSSNWLRGMGAAAFAFFLIKGLLWLAVAFMAIEVSCG